MNRYSEFDDAADLCSGQQVDQTPLLNTKASGSLAKDTPDANDRTTTKKRGHDHV